MSEKLIASNKMVFFIVTVYNSIATIMPMEIMEAPKTKKQAPNKLEIIKAKS